MKSRDSRIPADLGVWTGDPVLALYFDDGITKSLAGVSEAKLHALIVARICAVERIPLNHGYTKIHAKFLSNRDERSPLATSR